MDEFPGPNDVQLLDMIRRSLLPTLNSPTYIDDCQRVKSLLYDRQWLEVFTDSELVKVYAGKWVPSRALCYRDLFWYLRDVREYLNGDGLESVEPLRTEDGLGSRLEGLDLEDVDGDGDKEDEEEKDHGDIDNEGNKAISDRPTDQARLLINNGATPSSRKHVLSLGGGAGSELLATGAIIAPSNSTHNGANILPEDGDTAPHGKWTGMDIGPWQETIDLFTSTLRRSLSNLEVEYVESDLLASPSPSGQPSKLEEVMETDPPGLITILFTLLELFSQSRPATITLLRSLTRFTRPGTLLLVADSASDLGEIPLGENGRKWPVYMVLDLLLGVQPGKPSSASQTTYGHSPNAKNPASGNEDKKEEDKSGRWELLSSSDSRWYRLPEGVGASWSVKLENTRYWHRLYRRL